MHVSAMRGCDPVRQFSRSPSNAHVTAAATDRKYMTVSRAAWIAASTDNVHMMWRLVRSASPTVKLQLLRNPHTPGFILERLAADTNPEVAVKALVHRRMPAAVLRRYAMSDEPVYQRCVAMNPSTPADTLTELSLSDDLDVLFALTVNEATPDRILGRLAEGPDRLIAAAAELSLGHPPS